LLFLLGPKGSSSKFALFPFPKPNFSGFDMFFSGFDHSFSCFSDYSEVSLCRQSDESRKCVCPVMVD
jgi:hypothetical protein